MFSINDFYMNVSSKTFLTNSQNESKKVFDENLFIKRVAVTTSSTLPNNGHFPLHLRFWNSILESPHVDLLKVLLQLVEKYTLNVVNWERHVEISFNIFLLQYDQYTASIKDKQLLLLAILKLDYNTKNIEAINEICQIMGKINKILPLEKNSYLKYSCLVFTPNIPVCNDERFEDLTRLELYTKTIDEIDPIDLLTLNPVENNLKRLPTDTRRWMRAVHEAMITLKTTPIDKIIKNRVWLLQKLSIFPITDLLDMSHNEFCDKFIIRLHTNQDKDELFDFMVTVFGYAFQDEVNEILNAHSEIIAGTLRNYAEIIRENYDEDDFVTTESHTNFQEFSMLYVKPPNTFDSFCGDEKKIDVNIQERDDSFESFCNHLKNLPKFEGVLTEDTYEMTSIIYRLLISQRNNSEIVDMFTDIFGLEFVELAFELVANRESIIKTIDKTKPSTGAIAKIPKARKDSKQAPTISSQVVVQSEKEKRLRKELRREEKRHLRYYKNDMEADGDLSETGFLPLPHLERFTAVQNEYEAACVEPILSTKSTKDSIFDRSAAANVNPSADNPHIYETEKKKKYGTLLLAEGTEIKNLPLYKQVHIPAIKNKPTDLLSDDQRIKLSSLDPLGQKVFSNIEQLNIIQSIVFETAYQSNENLLVCAPTGAGKTNIALLTITKCLQNYVVGTFLQDKNFKIVYVAPMKALAAEMTDKFSKQLRPIGVRVKELTGDMQLSPSEIKETQILVTTPEKWDVVTRKPDGDTALPRLVRLLIIDEVHLLNEDRGHVIEAIVARTLRLVEKTQTFCRIVGLSATLPNYIDVAHFLRVNLRIGLFYFDQRFRPVPLETTFIGCQENNLQQILDQACYDQTIQALRNGHQVMVFVHTRRGTVNTALALRVKAQSSGTLKLFQCEQSTGGYTKAKQTIDKSNYSELRDLFQSGMAVHHAGMLRVDRNHVERYFVEGHIRVLVCTATLAWGVNLPAHTVIIKGTSVYADGQYTDLNILDVQQIFGRAGRPQYDTSGHAIIITEMNRLDKYLRLMTNQIPIESKFIKHLSDNLNAEIVLGTVTTIDEAVIWLSYTYLLIRMKMNPLAYGIEYHEKLDDPILHERRHAMIHDCAKKLDAARMIRYNAVSGDLISTDYGRIASHFYIKYDTIMKFNEMMLPIMSEGEILRMLTSAEEFEQIRVRDEELDELMELLDVSSLAVGSVDSVPEKVNLLLQAYLTRIRLQTSSLIADMNYAVQNLPRLVRALFEIFLRLNNAIMAGRLLKFALMFDNQQWDYETPLRQFQRLSYEVLNKIERHDLKIYRIRELDQNEIGNIIRNHREAGFVKHLADCFPYVDIETVIMPITRHVLRIIVDILPDFKWDTKIHGFAQSFWLWIEDPEHNIIYHHEYFTITKKLIMKNEPIKLFITIPLVDPTPPQYYVRVYSDKWLRAESETTFKFNPSMLPSNLTIQTDLENLQPLSKRVLSNPNYEALYSFNFFNPIQTQMFFVLYQTDHNILLGAPTGSGKTIVAELAILRLFNTQPNRKAIYVAPLKALVRERVDDWTKKFGVKLKKKVAEMTGDSMPDKRTLDQAHIIITTPEKWDIVTRNWESRSYVQAVGLLIMDEVHLLGEDRGPVLEAIVSRTNYIASKHNSSIRMMGLSTGIANSYDLATWLGVREEGLFNFRPSVRPVPLEVHISGYPGKHYCPRMALMNKPTFQAIREHAPSSPTLVFVSSRRQTRITAMELINFLNMDSNSYQWLHVSEEEINHIVENNIMDETLQHTLIYGVGVHHAGLLENDRAIVEDLFLNQKIQVLVATATLAWGVNFPAHLVVIKGTEYYDGKHRRYIDMPITDVLQMMGRAGRPQFDQNGVAVVLVQDIKKSFYKKFLYEPFPVESHMLEVLPNHIYAEIATGLIISKQIANEYITWTYLYRRLINNPTYYNLTSTEDTEVLEYINNLVDSTIDILVEHNCCTVDQEGFMLQTTPSAKVGSNYYLDYRTVKFITDMLHPNLSLINIIKTMCDTYEFSEVPVRHNEDLMNASLARSCRIHVTEDFDSPHVKTFLLIQSHLSRLPVPCADYSIDLKLILEQIGRVLQAFLDYAAVKGWISLCVRIAHVSQMIVQANWIDTTPYAQIPGIIESQLSILENVHYGEQSIPFCKFVVLTKQNTAETQLKLYKAGFTRINIRDIINYVEKLPILTVHITLKNAYSKKIWFGNPTNNDDKSTTILKLKNNRVYALEIRLTHYKKYQTKVFAPFYPKNKQESWLILFGFENPQSRIFMKRCIFSGKSTCQIIKFTTPDFPGEISYRLLIISDSYFGLDQEYTILTEIEMCEESDDEQEICDDFSDRDENNLKPVDSLTDDFKSEFPELPKEYVKLKSSAGPSQKI